MTFSLIMLISDFAKHSQEYEMKKYCFLQEYEAITRGLIRGNPSVPVQGTAEELKQVLLTCDLLVVKE